MTNHRMWIRFVSATILLTGNVLAGPIDPVPIEHSGRDLVVVAKWVKSKEGLSGPTTFHVESVATRHRAFTATPGETFEIRQSIRGKAGQRFLLTGSAMKRGIVFALPWKFTETRLKYLSAAPRRNLPAKKQIAYYLTFFEHTDRMIADDVFYELYSDRYSAIPFKGLSQLTDDLPRKRLREFIYSTKGKANPEKRSVYAAILGLCGDETDVKRFEKLLKSPSNDYRIESHGIICGYLWMTGEKGLKVVEKTKFQNPNAWFSESYAGFRAILDLWDSGRSRIKKPRLMRSITSLLDNESRSNMFDLVVEALAHRKQWHLLTKVMKRYGVEPYNNALAKLSIICFVLASIDDRPSKKGAETPKHVVLGRKYLKALVSKDPKMVTRARKQYAVRFTE